MNEKNILIGAQVFCWPKIINPLGHKTILRPSAEGWFCVLRWKKTQILIAHQKEEIDRTQKSPAIRQKKFG